MATPPPAFPRALLHPRHWLSWMGAGGMAILAFVPGSLRHRLGALIGHMLYRRNRKRRSVVLTNLQACFPKLPQNELETLARSHFSEYVSALLDYSILFFRSRKWLLRQIDLEGYEQLERSLQQQNNIILLLGHSVWLEFAPLAIGQRHAAYGSYKPFRNQVVDWLITRSRLKDVEFVVAREEGMIKLVRSLEPGRLLFFLPDQDHGEKHSVFAPFFATQKATLTTPARIARMGKADSFPVIAFFDHTTRRYRIVIGDKLEPFGQQTPEADAATMNTGFSRLIELKPVQYMWTLKLLRTRPKGENPLY